MFARVSGMQTHTDRDSSLIHEQSHLDNWIRTMFLAAPILAQSFQNLSGNRINVLIVWFFRFKIEIGAVIVHDRSLPGNNIVALLVEPGQIIVIMFLQHIHKPHNMLVGKIRLLIIGIQPIPSTVLGTWIENPRIGQKTIDIIAVVSHLSIRGYLRKELFQIQLPNNVLQKKVSGIDGSRPRRLPVSLSYTFVEITCQFNLKPTRTILSVHLVNFSLNICNRIICNFQQL